MVGKIYITPEAWAEAKAHLEGMGFINVPSLPNVDYTSDPPIKVYVSVVHNDKTVVENTDSLLS